MAGIDASIISGIKPFQVQQEDPLSQYGKSLTLQGLLGQQKLQGIQTQAAQQGLADEQGTRQAFIAGDGDSTATRAALQKSGNYKALMAFDKSEGERKLQESTIGKNNAAASKSNLDAEIQQAQHGASLLQAAKDNPAAWPAVRRAFILQFPNKADQVPEQFDPQFLDATISMGQTIAQKLTDQRARETQAETVRANQTREKETGRHNVVSERTAQGNLAVAQGNLGVARSNAAASVGKPFEVTNPDTGQPMLVRQDRQGNITPVEGFQPKGMGTTKLTEDQGKATGWLVQANNAYTNMQGAMKETPGAENPGLNDVLGAVPSFGVANAAANLLRGEGRQKFLQGASSLGEALLRAATGAGVNKDEAVQKSKELTPQIGDSSAVIKQKMDSIPLYIESLKVRAGPGAKQLSGIIERGTAATGKPVTIKGDDGFNALPSGSEFIGPDGIRRRKP